MNKLYSVFKLGGAFVGYGWASDPSKAIELVTGKQCQDYAHIAKLSTDQFADVRKPKAPKGDSPIHDPWGMSNCG